MRIFWLLFILLLIASSCATFSPRMYYSYDKTGPLVISEKVGATIEPAERNKYNLFHNVKDFKSASFQELKGGGYELEIMTADHRYIAVNRDSLALAILRDYIDNYETIKDSIKKFESKWRIISYDTLGQPITRFEVGRTYYTCCCAGGFGLVEFCGTYAAVPIITFVYWFASILYGFEMKEINTTTAAVIVGTSSALIGLVVGHIIDNSQQNNRIKKIKEARKPRLVE